MNFRRGGRVGVCMSMGIIDWGSVKQMFTLFGPRFFFFFFSFFLNLFFMMIYGDINQVKDSRIEYEAWNCECEEVEREEIDGKYLIFVKITPKSLNFFINEKDDGFVGQTYFLPNNFS